MTNMANVTIANLTSSWTDPTRDYTGLGLNITATSYDPSSKVFKLKVNGNTIFSVDASGTVSAPTISIANAVVDIASPFNKANAAFNVANVAFDSANAEYTFSNSIYAAVNSAFGVINAAFASANNVAPQVAPAFNAANQSGVIANGAFSAANQSGVIANSAFGAANQSGVIANVGFGAANQAGVIANAAFAAANNLSPQISPTFNAANQAGVVANSAFGAANQAGVIANAAFLAQNNQYTFTNVVYAAVNSSFGAANQSGVIANAAFLAQNNQYTFTNVVYAAVNSSFGAANQAGVIANGSFGAANQSGVIANVGFGAANQAGVIANAAFGAANQSGVIANSAFGAANQAGVIANVGFNQANTARDRANDAYGLAQQLGGNAANSIVTNQASFNTANGAFAAANSISVSANNYAGVMANSANAWANTKVSSVTGTSGRITSSGGTAPAIDLATAGAGAASYSSGISALTVDAYGRVTSVTGSAGYITSSASITGTAAGLSGLYTATNASVIAKRRNRIHSSDGTSMDTTLIGQLECGFNYGTSSGVTGPYITFGGLGGVADYQAQFTTNYGDATVWKGRCRNDDNSTWSSWRTFLIEDVWINSKHFGSDGNIYSNASMRAPIFYDQNNTGFYVDPDGGGFNMRGGTSNRVTFSTSDSGLFIGNAEGNGVNSIRLGAAWGRPGLYSPTYVSIMADSSQYIEFVTNNVQRGYIDSSSNLFAFGSMRSPIFYDSNDTGYYVDPNADRSSNINGFSARTVEGTKGTYKYNIPRYIHTGDTNYWVGTMGWGTTDWNSVFDWGSGFVDSWSSPANAPPSSSHHVGMQVMHYTNGSTRYGWQLAGGTTSNLYYRNVWGGGFSGWRTVVCMGVNENNTGGLYADILYDSNNTAYYVDPAGDSRINNITNNMQLFGGYGSGSGPGLTFENQSTFIRFAFWDLDFYDWNVGSVLRLNSFAQSDTSMRAPIFYDSNDTNFYVDPNGTSVLNTVYFNSGYGSSAPAYAIRAWVSFNGTNGTIFASQGVTSVTRNTTGDYRVNFNFTMPDANYAVSGAGMEDNGQNSGGSYQSAFSLKSSTSTTTTSCGILNANVDQGDNKDGARIMFMAVR